MGLCLWMCPDGSLSPDVSEQCLSPDSFALDASGQCLSLHLSRRCLCLRGACLRMHTGCVYVWTVVCLQMCTSIIWTRLGSVCLCMCPGGVYVCAVFVSGCIQAVFMSGRELVSRCVRTLYVSGCVQCHMVRQPSWIERLIEI